MNIRKLAVACLIGMANVAFGQISFVELSTSIVDVQNSSSAFADVDNDNDQDLFIIGESSAGVYEAILYINDGSGGFTEKTGQPFVGIIASPESLAFGDVNGDTHQDIFMAGKNALGGFEASIYINDGTGSFTLSVASNFGSAVRATAIFGDFIEDGDLDLFYAGDNGSVAFSEIYENDGTGAFTSANAIFGGYFPSADTADLNGNGHLDFILNSAQTGSLDRTQLNIGNGDGSFLYPAQGYFNPYFGTVRLADMNGDGFTDLFVTGSQNTGNTNISSSVYFNDGTANFTEHLSHGLEGVMYGDVEFADFDSDGDLDVAMLGDSIGGVPSTFLYENDGSGTFALLTSFEFVNLNSGSISVADVDGNGTPELFVNGVDDSNTPRSILYSPCLIDNVVIDQNACVSYDFDGATLTNSGTYNATFTNQVGCDSLVTLNLSIRNETHYENVYTTASSFAFGGNTLTTSGNYNEVLTNQSGCDSLVYLNLNFEPDPSTIASHTWFEPIMPEGTPQLQADFDALTDGDIRMGDLDGDGDLDVVVSGVSYEDQTGYARVTSTRAYRNDGSGNFSEIIEAGLLGRYDGDTELFDADGDGDLDIIQSGRVLYDIGATTTLDLNDGTGKFSRLTSSGLPGLYWGNIEIGDLDEDGDLDVVLTGRDDSSVKTSQIFFNQGNGEFVADTQSTLTPMTEGGLAIGDINGDDHLDIVLTGKDESNFTQNIVYLNDGFGVFTEYSGANLDQVNAHPILLDVDGNNTLDIVLKKKLYLNDGTGTFSLDASGPLSSFVTPKYTITNDFDQDGIQDLAFLRGSESQVLLGNGEGAFLISESIIGHKDGGAATGDLNGDGYPEILMSGIIEIDDRVDTELYINDGTGKFDENQLYSIEELSYGDAQFADLDGDGDMDLITNGNALEAQTLGEDDFETTKLYFNDGTGNFTEDNSHPFLQLHGTVLLKDFDGDTDIDVLLSGYEYNYLSSDPTPYDGVTALYENDGSGQFTLKSSSGIQEDTSFDVMEAADVDNDGDLDLVLNARLMINDGTGAFTQSGNHDFTGLTFAAMSFGDVNNDGYTDLFRSGSSSNAGICGLYLNDGLGGLYLDATNSFSGMLGGSSDFADIDDDGDLDLFVAGWQFESSSGYEHSYIYFNDGTGNFTEDQFNEIINVADADSQFADLDGDGDEDLIVSGITEINAEQFTKVYLNNGRGHFREYEYAQFVAMRGTAIAIADLDNNGSPDVFLSGYRRDTESRLYRNTLCQDETNDIVVEALGSYHFFGQDLTTSGLYVDVRTNGCGKSITTNLNLTITPLVIWENESWSNITGPIASDPVEINDNYATDLHGDFVMARLQVNSDHELTIASGSTLDVKGDLINNGSLVVESGASLLTYEADQVKGRPITFKRNTRYADGRYSMVGSPVESNASITGDDLGPVVYSYDESIAFNDGSEDGIDRWVNASSETLETGVGYAAAGQQTITFEGTPNDGTISFSGLSRTEDVTTTSDNWGWHLVSNPYPAAIDFGAFISGNSNIQGTIALWDDHGSDTGRGTNADYLIANSIGAVTGPNGGQFEGYIGSMQGFFVQVGDGQTGDLVFTEAMREIGNNEDFTFFRKAETDIPNIKLAISAAEGDYSETLIGFPEDATKGLDRLYDAARLKSHSNFNISTLAEELQLAIQGLTMNEQMEIPLMIDYKNGGKIRFSLTQSSLPDHLVVVLKDPLGFELELESDSSIEIDIEAGKNIIGYSILIGRKAILGTENPHFSIFLEGDFIVAHSIQKFSVKEVKLLDLMGRELKIETESIGQNLHIRKPTTSGIYILLIETNKEVFRTKLLINH